MLTNFVKLGNRLFTKYLLATNIAATCGLMNAGDFVVQGLQVYFDESRQKKNKADEWVDWDRSGRVFKIGVVAGALTHYWYAWLDLKFPGRTTKTILKKILLDQTIASPVFMSVYFIGHSLLEKETFRDGVNRVKDKFWVVYLTDWSYWPVIQGINFRYIPDRYRVIYVGASSLVWTVFLSFMQFVDEKHLGKAHEEKESIGESKNSTARKKSLV